MSNNSYFHRLLSSVGTQVILLCSGCDLMSYVEPLDVTCLVLWEVCLTVCRMLLTVKVTRL